MRAQNSMMLLARAKGVRHGVGLTSLMLLASVSYLTGCSGLVSDAPTEAGVGAVLKGNVHGGQQPISGGIVQLYSAPATGYNAAAIPLGAAVTTDSGGNFTLGAYVCPASPADQTYIVSTGGDSGSGVNANIALITALGPCGSLSPSTFIYINEVTTVASTYALSGFMSDYKHVGTSATNYIGLKNAMATVNNLVNAATGVALTVTPAYVSQATGTTSATFRSTVPQSEIYTLANILAACVNTNGVGGSSINCAGLFDSNDTNTTTGGVSGTPDTVQAALNIAHKPGTNVANIYAYNLPLAPFSPVLASAPNDWTMVLSYVGGGLGGTIGTNDAGSIALAIDGTGNVWIGNNRRNSITELSPLGAPLSPNTKITPSVVLGGFTGGGLTNPNALAADTLGNMWVANSSAVLSEFTSAGTPVGTGFTGGGLVNGVNLAVDGLNNVWIIGTSGSSTMAEFSNAGTPLSPVGGITPNIANPAEIAIDGAESVFVGNGGNGILDKFNQAEALQANSVPILTNIINSSAVDASGLFWSPYNAGVQTFANATATWTGANYQNFTISGPSSISIDGDNHVWLASDGGVGTQAAFANLTELTTTGTSITPATTGYQSSLLGAPKGTGIDASGNLWVVNGILASAVNEFVGVAAPTYMPLAAANLNNAIGQRP